MEGKSRRRVYPSRPDVWSVPRKIREEKTEREKADVSSVKRHTRTQWEETKERAACIHTLTQRAVLMSSSHTLSEERKMNGVKCSTRWPTIHKCCFVLFWSHLISCHHLLLFHHSSLSRRNVLFFSQQPSSTYRNVKRMLENCATFSSKCFLNILKLSFNHLQQGETLCSVIWFHFFYCCSCIIVSILLFIVKHFSYPVANCKELSYKMKRTFYANIVPFCFSDCHQVQSHGVFLYNRNDDNDGRDCPPGAEWNSSAPHCFQPLPSVHHHPSPLTPFSSFWKSTALKKKKKKYSHELTISKGVALDWTACQTFEEKNWSSLWFFFLSTLSDSANYGGG